MQKGEVVRHYPEIDKYDSGQEMVVLRYYYFLSVCPCLGEAFSLPSLWSKTIRERLNTDR
jgi:hypothetical protein